MAKTTSRVFGIPDKLLKCYTVLFGILVIYLVLLVNRTKDSVYVLAGGFVGLLSSSYVMYDVVQTKNYGLFNTLFWRAFCDLCLTLRFLLTPAFNYYLCGSSECTRGDANADDCQLFSFFFQFFIIASETWFLCNGLELYYSITNPFTNFEARVKKYHILAWSAATLFSVFPFFTSEPQEIYGLWYVSNSEDNTAICWLKTEGNQLGYAIWFLFLVPLAVVYVFCVLMVVFAYFRLQKGLNRSFLPRLQLLVTNTSNVVILAMYWGVFFLIYAFAFFTRFETYTNDMFGILTFILGSKGSATLLIWFINSDISKKVRLDEKNETVDANSALREEVLSFATAGIRSTARAGPTVGAEDHEIVRKPREHNTNSKQNPNKITPLFFIKFLLCETEEVLQIHNMISTRRRSVNATGYVSTTTSGSQLNSLLRPSEDPGRVINPMIDDRSSLATPDAHDRLSSLESRLSQRPTIVTISSETSKTRRQFNFSTENSPTNNNNNNSNNSNNNNSNNIRDDDAHSDISSIRDSSFAMGAGGGMNSIGGGGGGGGAGGNNSMNPRASTDSSRASDMVDAEQFSEIRRRRDAEQGVGMKLCDKIKKSLWSLFDVDASDDVEFTEFEPYHFRRVRLAAGISDEIYIRSFSTTIKERLTQGGASGAFFFFSKGEKFIAKSCTKEEVETLDKNAKAYADYMVKYPDSYISKIFGAYKLRIYGNSLCFFVMNNLFFNKEGLTMNEKYDIKGSWVARNAEPPMEGQSLTCSYCEQKFIYQKKKKTHRRVSISKSMRESSTSISGKDNKEGIETILKDLKKSATISQMYISDSDSADILEEGNGPGGHGTGGYGTGTGGYGAGNGNGKEKESKEKNDSSYDATQCPYTVNGEHEPNIILKDNDIKYKIRLPPETTAHLLTRVRSDAEFLYSLGIMDYSLLVGVHNTEYSVRLDTVITGNSDTGIGSGISSGNGGVSQQLVAFRPNASFTPFQITKPSEIAVSSSSPLPVSTGGTTGGTSSGGTGGGGGSGGGEVRHRTESNMSVTSTGTIEYIQRSTGQSEAHVVGQSIVSAMTGTGTGGLPRVSQGVSSSADGSSGYVSQEQHAYMRGDVFDEADLSLTRKLDVYKVVGPDSYFMGIIDFQQQWNMQKKLERFLKINFRGVDPQGLSAIEPETYKERFLRKIEDILDIESIKQL